MVLNHSYDYSTTGTMNNKEWIVKMKEFIGIIERDVIADDATNELLSTTNFTGSTYVDQMSVKMAPTSTDVLSDSNECSESAECGFPSITLNGNKSDWVNLKSKAVAILQKTGMNQWRESLIPILERFVAVFDGDIDCVFWNSMIQRGATS